MATRFYLPSTGAADVSPAFDASWERTADADRLKCVTTKISSAMTDRGLTGTGVALGDVLVRQYVSDALSGAQTITGTLKAQILSKETAAANNFFPQILVYVVSNDGSTVRGTLLAHKLHTTVTEFATVFTNHMYHVAGGDTLSSVNALDTDRIVIEVGQRQNSTNANAHTNHKFGDNSATDLTADDETVTTLDNPWVEFSQTLTFSGAIVVSGIGAIASAEAFGSPALLRLLQNIGAIATAETVGQPKLLRLLQKIGAIASGEAFGKFKTIRLIGTQGIASAEAFGVMAETGGTIIVAVPIAYGDAVLADVPKFDVIVVDRKRYAVYVIDAKSGNAIVGDKPGG